MPLDIDEVVETFALLDDWDDRYRYLIDLGRSLEPMPEEAHSEDNRVLGCASRVWVETSVDRSKGEPVLRFRGDSDAHIVRGLVALTLAFYSDRPARDILAADVLALFKQLGLSEHLTPQRSNGVRSMVERIRRDAQASLAVQA